MTSPSQKALRALVASASVGLAVMTTVVAPGGSLVAALVLVAIVAYLQPVSRPEIARIRGVNSDSPVATLEERGLVEEKGRSQFGAILYRTTPLFQKLFGLEDRVATPS